VRRALAVVLLLVAWPLELAGAVGRRLRRKARLLVLGDLAEALGLRDFADPRGPYRRDRDE